MSISKVLVKYEDLTDFNSPLSKAKWEAWCSKSSAQAETGKSPWGLLARDSQSQNSS